MFTATWPKEVHALAGEMLKDPIRVNVGDTNLKVVKTVKQNVTVCEEMDKPRMLEKVTSPSRSFCFLNLHRVRVVCNHSIAFLLF
jgi:superfamily II DNA/RNA helicase